MVGVSLKKKKKIRKKKKKETKKDEKENEESKRQEEVRKMIAQQHAAQRRQHVCGGYQFQAALSSAPARPGGPAGGAGARPANLIGRSVILHGPGPAAGSLAPASRWRPAQVHGPGPAAGILAPASRRRQWKHCQLGSAGADGPATGAGTCRDDVHRPWRPYLLLVRARPPLVSAPLKLVSGVDCSDRVWRQGVLH